MKKTVLQYLIACYLFFFVTLLGLTGLGFLVAGLYLILGNYLATWAAALVSGVALLFVALVLLLIVMMVTKSNGGNDSDGEQDSASHEEMTALVMEMLQKSDFNARDASLIALVVGTVLGASPELRRQLFGRRENK